MRQHTVSGLGGLLRLGLAGAMLALAPGVVPAATNVATGDIAGDPNALEDSAPPFVLTSTGNRLALVKRAFLEDGTRVPDGSGLPNGSVVKFMIYINNDSPVDVHDVQVRDVLDPAFAYQTGTIKVDNSVGDCALPACTQAEEDTIFAAVNGAAAGTDAVDPLVDVVSHVAGTIEAVSGGPGEVQNDLAGGTVWAMLFTVKVQ